MKIFKTQKTFLDVTFDENGKIQLSCGGKPYGRTNYLLAHYGLSGILEQCFESELDAAALMENRRGVSKANSDAMLANKPFSPKTKFAALCKADKPKLCGINVYYILRHFAQIPFDLWCVHARPDFHVKYTLAMYRHGDKEYVTAEFAAPVPTWNGQFAYKFCLDTPQEILHDHCHLHDGVMSFMKE